MKSSSTIFQWILFLILFIFAGFSVNAQDTFRIIDYGVKPGSRVNAVQAVQKALEECRKSDNPVLVFEKGRYDFWPQHSVEKVYYESNTYDVNPKRCPIYIEGFEKLTIDGQGSEFIFHDRVQPFTIDHSSNISIKNLDIDWDILLTAQAEVINLGNSFMDLKINTHESPYVIEGGKLYFVGEGWKSLFKGQVMEFELNTRLIVPQTGDSGCCGGHWKEYRAEELSPGIVRINKPYDRQPEIGNYLVLRHSTRDHSGAFVFHSNNIFMENINFYHAAGLGVLSQYSKDLTYKNVNFSQNLQKNRYLSGHDDGFQVSNCAGQVNIVDCNFGGLMDDPINVHGTSVKIIEKISDTKLKCLFVHGMSVGMLWGRPGEKVGFLENESMRTVAEGTLKSFKALNTKEFVVEFEQATPEGIAQGDALENLTWVPDLTVKGCFFGSCRARGLLVSTPGKVIIENNIFESSGSAILISGDANYWYESGAVKDVIIRNNTFNDPCLSSMYQFCEAIISIYPVIPEVDTNHPFHRNIRITNNTFFPFDYPVLYAKSVDGLSFKDNKIIRSKRFKPFHNRKSTLSFNACKNVQIEGNELSEDVLGKNISFENMKREWIKVGKGWIVTNLRLMQHTSYPWP